MLDAPESVNQVIDAVLPAQSRYPDERTSIGRMVLGTGGAGPRPARRIHASSHPWLCGE
jgi:hypothetical protein